ncbi:helix-turn-helix domain-containing protein [Yinghuangia sp. YIM S09857]|uniref:helix-turn-helix domain-containing protein n=1 Tax=Yinghuangia sp. YIM S09857 TaxID=3436929 RepID=UPI003F52E9E9
MAEDGIADALAGLGPRLRSAREDRGASLTDASREIGVAPSALSRFENGRRTPGLEVLLRLARAYGVSLDELAGAGAGTPPEAAPPRAPRGGTRDRGHTGEKTRVPLTPYVGGLHAHKHVLPASDDPPTRPRQVSHEGYEWLCVLYGRLWLALGADDLVLAPGEVAEFDTRTPHGLANAAADGPVEYLIMFGPQGERLRPRTRPGDRR